MKRFLDRQVGSMLVSAGAVLTKSGTQMGAPSPGGVRRILAIKLHGVGNIALLQPALRGLQEHFARAEVDFLTFRSNEEILPCLGPIASAHYIDESTATRAVLSALKLIPTLRARSFDLVVDFEQFANLSAILAMCTGARSRVGFRIPGSPRHKGFTTPVVYSDTRHMRGTFSRLAIAAGVTRPIDLSMNLRLDPNHLDEAVEFENQAGIDPGDVVFVLHPGSSPNLTLRRWPAERFAALADRLAGRHGVRVVLSGSREERGLAQRVRAEMQEECVSSVGRLSLGGLAALCGRAEAVLSSDTALVHIASAVGTPVVGLYGPNTPYLYGPTGRNDLVFYQQLPCSPCLMNILAKVSRCRRALCMEKIGVDEVYAGISRTYFDEKGRILPIFKRDRGGKGPKMKGVGDCPPLESCGLTWPGI
ncbi:MAG: glycosyltransferase family 9 protein [Deferrisomatales bacterium]|nr:glycosyltransferase family 9 protein [Deferrisomatales bacterium]